MKSTKGKIGGIDSIEPSGIGAVGDFISGVLWLGCECNGEEEEEGDDLCYGGIGIRKEEPCGTSGW